MEGRLGRGGIYTVGYFVVSLVETPMIRSNHLVALRKPNTAGDEWRLQVSKGRDQLGLSTMKACRPRVIISQTPVRSIQSSPNLSFPPPSPLPPTVISSLPNPAPKIPPLLPSDYMRLLPPSKKTGVHVGAKIKNVPTISCYKQ